MSFAAPGMLIVGALVALGVVALHLLTTRRPPASPLPTARFVPESSVRAVSRAQRPTDLLLLALRVLAVLALATAFARPVPNTPGPKVRTLEVTDSAGSLSTLLVRARDSAATLARGADSVRLVIRSTFASSAFDAATPTFRALWPGRIELERLPVALDTARGPRPDLFTALPDDPLAPALTRARATRGAHAIRVYRLPERVADTAWVAAGQGRVAVEWPPLAVTDSSSARLCEPSAHLCVPAVPDAVTLFSALGPVTLVAPLGRVAPDSIGRVIARWRDGTPAITERAIGAGCLRSVGVALPGTGDLTLREPFARLLDGLLEPCGGARAPAASDSLLTAFAGEGPIASAKALVDLTDADRTLPLVLLVLAAAALMAEQLLRRRRGGVAGVAGVAGAPMEVEGVA